MMLTPFCKPVVRMKKGMQHLLRRGRRSLPHHIYHVTASTSGRRRLFLSFEAACAAARCFEDPAILGEATMLAWVLMPDHVHWLLQLGEDGSLPETICRLKSASARAVNAASDHRGPVWSRGYHDRALRRETDCLHVARYIVANPLCADLAKRVGDYPFWNTLWL